MLPRSRPSPAVWVFLAALLARAWVACARLDELELEIYAGSFARALQLGLPLDPERLPIIDHLRGSVLYGTLLVPLFELIGPRLEALKLLAVLVSALGAALLALCVERRLGRGAAWCAGAALVFAPPHCQMVSVLALGSHEAVPSFVLLALAVLLIGAAPKSGFSAGGAALFGTCCAAGLAFSMQFVVALPALALAWLALDPRCWRRASSLLVVGCAALALVPIRLISVQGKLVTKPAGEHVLPHGLSGAADKLARTLLHDLRESWLFEFPGGDALGWLVLLALAFGLACTARAAWRREPLALYALAHPALLLAAFVISDFEINLDNRLDGMGSRYFLPIQPCFALWIAFGAHALWTRGARALARAYALAPLAAGAVGILSLGSPLTAARQPAVRATDYTGFGFHLAHAAGANPAARLAWIDRLDPDWPELRPLAYQQLVCLPGEGAWDVARLRAAAARAISAPLALQRHLLAGLGAQAARAQLVPRELDQLAGVLDAEQRAWLVGGAARGLYDSWLPRKLHGQAQDGEFAAAVAAWPEDVRAHFARGMGFLIGQRVSPYNPYPLKALLEALTLPPAQAQAYFHGAGLGWRLRYVQSSYAAPEAGALRIESLLGEPAASWFRAGLAAPLDEPALTAARE
jgi:hypothetical protein